MPHILPSTVPSVSASATLLISWLNPPPHPITVYASHPPLPTTTQHSLPGGALPPYRGRSFTGRIAPASPDAPELKVRIHPPPAAIRRTPTRTGTTSAAANNRVPQVRRDVSWCASQDPAIYSHLPENLGESGSPHKSDTRCSGLWTRWQNRFATDSPLEGRVRSEPVSEMGFFRRELRFDSNT